MRRGNWIRVQTEYDGPRWQLDGTTLQLEHDPSSHACCAGGPRCNGAWVLYDVSRTYSGYVEPVAEHLDGAMAWVEQQRRRAAEVVNLPEPAGLPAGT